LKAVHRLHFQVGQHQVEGLLFHCGQRRRAVAHAGNRVTGDFKGHAHGVAQGRVVFDYKDVQGFRHVTSL